MQRRVERRYIDQWVGQNRPDAIRKLATKSNVNHAYIERVRAGFVPPKELYREALAEALGVSAEVLFPLDEEDSSGGSRAG
jgi:transcriptional regulator with XRE-family HTH domain